MACSWIGVGAVYPASETAFRTSEERPRSAKFIECVTLSFSVLTLRRPLIGGIGWKVKLFRADAPEQQGECRPEWLTSRRETPNDQKDATAPAPRSPLRWCLVAGANDRARERRGDRDRRSDARRFATRHGAAGPGRGAAALRARLRVDGRLCRPGDHAPGARKSIAPRSSRELGAGRYAGADGTPPHAHRARPQGRYRRRPAAALAGSRSPRTTGRSPSARYVDHHGPARRARRLSAPGEGDHRASRRSRGSRAHRRAVAGAVRTRRSRDAACLERGDGIAHSRRRDRGDRALRPSPHPGAAGRGQRGAPALAARVALGFQAGRALARASSQARSADAIGAMTL